MIFDAVGRMLTAIALLAATGALLMSGCGGSDSSTVGPTTTNAKIPRHSHAIMLNGDDAAFKAFCKAKDAAGRRLQVRALRREILASPNAPAIPNVQSFTHELKGLCAGPPKRVNPAP